MGKTLYDKHNNSQKHNLVSQYANNFIIENIYNRKYYKYGKAS